MMDMQQVVLAAVAVHLGGVILVQEEVVVIQVDLAGVIIMLVVAVPTMSAKTRIMSPV